MPPKRPKNMGLFSRATVCAIVTSAPVKMPALPKPAVALPMMSAVDVGAIPQIREPSSNTNSAERKTILTLKRA